MKRSTQVLVVGGAAVALLAMRRRKSVAAVDSEGKPTTVPEPRVAKVSTADKVAGAASLVRMATSAVGPVESASINGLGQLVRTRSRIVRGLSGLGADAKSASIQYSPNAFVSPEFRENKPGTYQVDLTIEAVPFSEEKLKYLTASNWTKAMRDKGVNATVTKVVATGSTNPRTAGMFGYGEYIADFHYRLTVDFKPADGGVSAHGIEGLGAVQLTGWAIVGLGVLVGYVYYLFTNHNVLVDLVKFIGGGVAAAGVGIALPVIGIAALALFVLKKGGAKVRTPFLSTGG